MGRCLSITQSDGTKTVMTYDVNGNLTSAYTGDTGRTCKYDGNGRLTLVKYSTGESTAYAYDRARRVSSVTYTDSDKTVTSYEYERDGAGNITKVTESCTGTTTSYTYDSFNRCTSVTDTQGNTQSITYNEDGTVSEVTGPYGTSAYTYDSRGRLTGYTAENGATYSYGYDNAGNLTEATDALGGTSYYSYGTSGELLTQTDQLGRTTTYEYDSLLRCVRKILPDKTAVDFTYDAAGNLLTATVNNSGEYITVSWSYDADGNPVSYTDENGCTINARTEADGSLSITDSAGNTICTSKEAKESPVYLPGQTTQVTDKLGGVAAVTFDQKGNLTQTEDVMGNTTTYTYDTLGRVISEENAAKEKTSYDYDSYGRLTKITDAADHATEYEYDQAGRITAMTDGLGRTEYTYDAAGNLLTVTDKNGTIKRTYDSRNRVSTYTDTKGNTQRYSYDALGNITKMTYPDGTTVTYGYSNGKLIKVTEETTDGQKKTTEYTRDEQGRITRTINANNTKEEYTYGENGKTSTHTTYADGKEIRSEVYLYNEDGSIASITVTGGENAVSVSSQSEAGEAVQNVYTYGKDNRMETFNGQKVEYDTCGNMTYGPVDGVMTRLTYDSRNRLIKAGSVAYEYDAENVRTATVTKDYREEYITDSTTGLSQVLISTRKYTSGITETRRYVYGNGLISEDWRVETGENSKAGVNNNDANKNSISYSSTKAGIDAAIITDVSCYRIFHYNHIGSTVMLTDENGNVKETYRYSAYGTVLDGNTDITPYLYNGQYGVSTEANGLNYMRARYYDSVSGRFINRDIVSGTIEDSRSLNRYAYCYGNPVSYADPFGLSPLVSMRNHAILDVLGMIPGPVGTMADLINAVYYIAEGDVKQAVQSVFFSAISAVPGVIVGKAAGLLGASENTAKIVNGIVYAAMGCAGVYFGTTQVSADIDRVSANWDSYSTEEKELEAQIFVCHLLGLGGSIAGSVSSAHEVAKVDSYQKWEAEVNKLVSDFVKDERGSIDLMLCLGNIIVRLAMNENVIEIKNKLEK